MWQLNNLISYENNHNYCKNSSVHIRSISNYSRYIIIHKYKQVMKNQDKINKIVFIVISIAILISMVFVAIGKSKGFMIDLEDLYTLVPAVIALLLICYACLWLENKNKH